MKTFFYSIVMAMTYFTVNAATANTSFYLISNEFSNKQVGIVVAVAGVAASVLQSIIARFVDKNKRISLEKAIGMLAVVAAVSASFLFFDLKNNFFLIGLFILFSMVATYIIMPLVNALAMYYINKGKKINFGVARGVASLAYTVAAIVIGRFSSDEYFGPKFIPVSIILASILLLLSIVFFNFKISEGQKKEHGYEKSQPTKSLIEENFIKKYPGYFIYLIGVTCLLIGHNVVNTFSYQLCVSLGYGVVENGFLNGVTALVEIPTMFAFNSLMKKFKTSTLLIISAVFFSLKILILCIALKMSSIYLMFLSGCMQMFAFALFIPASVHYTNNVIDKKDMATGQSRLMITSTIGATIGSLLGGFQMDYTSPTVTMWIVFGISVLGTIVCLKQVDRNS